MAKPTENDSATSITPISSQITFPFCAKEGVKEEEMILPNFKFKQIDSVKKGMVLELYLIQKKHNIGYEIFSEWLKDLFGTPQLPRKEAIMKSLKALQAKRSKLLKSASNRTNLDALLEEPYVLPKQQEVKQLIANPPTDRPTTTDSRSGVPSYFMQEAMKNSNTELAAEATLHKKESVQMKTRNAELLAKLHNIRRRERRKQQVIAEQRKLIKSLRKSLSKSARKTTLLYSKQHYYKSKYNAINHLSCEFCEEQIAANQQLKQTIIELQEMNAELHDKTSQSLGNTCTVIFFKDGRYSDPLRICVMELLTLGVSIHKVESVLKSVFRLVGISYDRLPKHTAINEMIIEARGLAQLQLAEQLSKESYSTLHSDGTSKFGHKYLGFQVSTSTEGSYTLGLSEVSSGSADTMLVTLNEILEQVEETCSNSVSSTTDVGKKILLSISNTMSDRASSQKSFNELLEAYRTDILPTVASDWADLSSDEQESMTTMYHFFCGVHLIGNMADHAAEAIRLFEVSYRDSDELSAVQECGPVRLVRTTCKAFERRGSEKSGYPIKFAAFLKRKGISKVPLEHFKGNRFNILFHNAACVFFLRDSITEFLTSVWGTPNQLLKSVLSDVKDEFNIAACKALGLIDKQITTSLWRTLESNDHILKVPEICSKLLSFLEKCVKDAQKMREFIEGEFLPFPSIAVKKDEVWASLLHPSQEIDSLVEMLLQAVFGSLSLLVTRYVNDSSFPDNSSSAQQRTISVPSSNIISERDFAKLDTLIRQKPSATLIALEAHIMFTNNRTSQWLSQKPEEEKEKLMEVARKVAPAHRKIFRERLLGLREQQEEALRKKQTDIEKHEKKVLAEKEKITADLVRHGLWLTEQEVNSGLRGIRSETGKREAIKVQLRFRKRVLEQRHRDMSLFQFSRSGSQLTSATLKTNLLLLLTEAA